MENVFRKAERKQSKIRISMAGVSGSGKTYSALRLARGLASAWNKVAMIDTENGRGDLYSDLGEYNIITLKAPFSPERFIEAIKTCEDQGMEVIIIDSISHEWEGRGGCLESNDQLAEVKFKENTWAAWSHTTPRHRKFIEAIIASPCHILTTMRSKTQTVMTDSKKVKKVGIKDIQREGFSYEMTVSFDIDREKHMALAGKDNTHLFEDENPFVISEVDGEKILKWNKSGKKDEPTKEQTVIFREQLKALKISRMKWEKATAKKWNNLSEEEAGIWIKRHTLKIELTKTKKAVKDREEEK